MSKKYAIDNAANSIYNEKYGLYESVLLKPRLRSGRVYKFAFKLLDENVAFTTYYHAKVGIRKSSFTCYSDCFSNGPDGWSMLTCDAALRNGTKLSGSKA